MHVRWGFLVFVLLQLSQIGHAQNSSRFDFFLGYGFYEGYHVGSSYALQKGTQSLRLSLGYDPTGRNHQESMALSAGYTYSLFRNHRNSSGSYKWSLVNRMVLWQLEDDYYRWRAVSFIPSISRRISIFKKIDLELGVGPSFNVVLESRRKTFMEIGRLYPLLPDIRVSCIF